MKSLLRQFIKNKIISKTPASNLSHIEFELKSPRTALFHHSDKPFGLRSSTIQRKVSNFEEKDKKIEQMEQELLDYKKKTIDFYFNLKYSLLVDNVCKILNKLFILPF